MHSVVAGITPSPRAGIGLSVIRAIATYAGRPIEVFRDGRTMCAYGLLEQQTVQIEVPGIEPLAPRWFSLVDVPDTHALPPLFPTLREVWVGAAPQPQGLHRLLIAFARLHRRGAWPALIHFARLMHFVTRWCRWGAHRGGMFVRVSGVGVQGGPCERTWRLIAEGDDGPFIPAMAAAAVIRRVMETAASPAVSLSVPLGVEIGSGSNWGAAH